MGMRKYIFTKKM